MSEDGTPVVAGTVESRSGEHGIQALEEIFSDGTFLLTTYERDGGAIAGTHDCVVVQMVMVEELPGLRPHAAGIVDPRYGSYSSSALQCRISA